ncbi:MAG: tRNA (adenosine(37)-N6)-dimethylallyltransferase MiaA [Anaerolineales bacterium]|nr:tRNA (adenosine(37)-N6)-dimethylallyltransferase MiaA [Anaerolineales bacterium]
MSLPSQRPPLLVILGPTAVGKTTLAIELAEKIGGEIVSVDSRYFYRGMDIGTAKPTFEERERVPHHLIDVADPDETWSLAIFQEAAQQAIADIAARGRLPMLVGGTGQYIRAITEGWRIPKQEPDHRLRDALERWAQEIGHDGLHQRLQVIDPQAAQQIDSRNLRRTVRALEVTLNTGKRFSEQRQRGASPYNLLQVGLTRPRPILYERIDARIDAMLQAGFMDEVRDLLEAGYPPDLPAFSAIGYSQMIQVLQAEISLDEAVMLMKRLTRQFVRRQANWFKPDDPDIHWFSVELGSVDEIEKLVREYFDW